ncbi:ADP-ribosylglycohydrolase family protein [Neobacillus drentensis]|uniref:ADP-ribosylglycohydrolase family protein n=1 Tax=Neobacillus drentensis TaxID=220684 RepID=UPI003001E97B
MLDKIKGGLFGVAIGDALGATTEFMSKEEIKKVLGRVTSIVGGGVWNVKPGETTDDTAMTMAVAKGIIANSLNPIEEIGKEFLIWRDTDPKDIGITIRQAFENFKGDWFSAAEKTHDQLNGKSAGNGSLMRCLPIAFAYSDQKRIDVVTELQSKMTHFDDLASEASVIYNRIARRLLEGEELNASILEEVKSTQYEQGLFQKPECPPDGFVVHTMKWVLYWLLTSHTFEEVVIGATNMGNDSDTIAAIAGGLKGIETGFYKLSYEFKSKLQDRIQLEEIATVINEIRDQDSVEVKNRAEEILKDLVSRTELLYQLVEGNSPLKENSELLESIRENIYLFRVSLQKDGDSDFNRKHFKWRCVENRYKRSKRLFDLVAPIIIILNELRWLRTEIEHMSLLNQGIEPHYTEEEQEELDSIAEFERSLEEEDQLLLVV